jgi:transcriptional regulator with XRE-family HTH domain
MPRSLKVDKSYLDLVRSSLQRNGYRNQRALAEEAGLSLATISNFLTGKAVDFSTFAELSHHLGLEWKEIASFDPNPQRFISSQLFEPHDSQSIGLFPYPNGPIPLSSPFYIERISIEQMIKEEIVKPGSLVHMRSTKGMGKTSLLLRIMKFATDQQYQVISLNLGQVDRIILDDLSQFLRWLCATVTHRLSFKSHLDAYWDRDLGCKGSCTAYLEDFLLRITNNPIVLALDEAQLILENPRLSNDISMLFRAWNEKSKSSRLWSRMRLVTVETLVHGTVTRENDAFSTVGLPINLSRFSQEEIKQLGVAYGLCLQQVENKQEWMKAAAGHPAIVHIVLYHLSRGEILPRHQLELLKQKWCAD